MPGCPRDRAPAPEPLPRAECLAHSNAGYVAPSVRAATDPTLPLVRLDAVLPPEHRVAVEADCPQVPLTYVDSEVTAPAGWTDGPTAYLAYGDTYSEDVTAATSYGWPVARLEGGHLHHLVEPDAVAAEVVRLLDLIGDRS